MVRGAAYLGTLWMALCPDVASAADWRSLDVATIALLQDDDLDRHSTDSDFLDGISVSEIRFAENGFNWHLLRFDNQAQPDGPLWVVPHDDENAAFDAMIAALKRHGGVGITVNSGTQSTRRQSGSGNCGVRTGMVSNCDPNRNFDNRARMFTGTILKQSRTGQPVIALHTNSEGFSGDGRGGRGDITMVDSAAYARGAVRTRQDGYLANHHVAGLGDPDVYAIMPYSADTGLRPLDVQCRTLLNSAGVNVWHERVVSSDGSLSNYLALNRPDIAYVNFEAKRERNLSIGAEAHKLMIDAYLKGCSTLWNKPAPVPAPSE